MKPLENKVEDTRDIIIAKCPSCHELVQFKYQGKQPDKDNTLWFNLYDCSYCQTTLSYRTILNFNTHK